MTAHTLLIEIFTEELPPKNLATLSKSFTDSIVEQLSSAQLMTEESRIKSFATPRRLAVQVSGVVSMQQDRLVERKGPAVSAGFDAEGNPTKALKGFAAGAGVEISALEKVQDGQREVFMAKRLQKGEALSELISGMMDYAIKRLPVAKNMRWRDLTETFVRPVHRLMILHGNTIIPYSRFGIESDRVTDGHRFLGQKNLVVQEADDYESALLQEGKVIADFSKRRESIVQQLDEAVKANEGDCWSAEQSLVDEVTALTENPTVIEGSFDSAFLKVPQEALILSMTQHQKYFPVLDQHGKMTSRFLLVANMPPSSSAPETIQKGNEKVLRARLSDAQFFYDTDRKEALFTRVDALKQVTYLQALADKDGVGASLYERIGRIAILAKHIAKKFPDLNADEVERAAYLAKADLVTGLVGEFPELQGIAGDYYARHDGEKPHVARAVREHYSPRFSGDALPESPLGQVIALADKIESIAGMFGLNRPPSGDKDPFGLRRAALGVIRMMVEAECPLDLASCFLILPEVFAKTAWKSEHEGGESALLMQNFMQDRLRQYLRDGGHEISRIDAVLSLNLTHYDDVLARLEALHSFCHAKEAARLIAMGKRIRNILKQQEVLVSSLSEVNENDLEEDSEKSLFVQVKQLQAEIHKCLIGKQFDQALQACVPLDAPLAEFFDKVMVMSDDTRLRDNRLSLLKQLDALLNGVAALGEIRLS